MSLKVPLIILATSSCYVTGLFLSCKVEDFPVKPGPSRNILTRCLEINGLKEVMQLPAPLEWPPRSSETVDSYRRFGTADELKNVAENALNLITPTM
ncbi:hypothetical protein PR048_008225 [Dryococelus australis]|uniref:Uncharacterized protein n=1 Tax=Dryococelus australis TaxID=614101 RepID=A0ABQ9HWI1_9NEOP|nr:hypothetical protein PR048_008225 [Dryococelus australis]